MGDTTLFLDTGLSVTVKIHPVVIFTVLDHYLRRNKGQERVIGTLLGSIVEGVVEIRNCFPVPHTEGDQVAVNKEFHRTLLNLHLKANPKEILVGWYATGSEITENSVHIQDFYWTEMGTKSPSPIHVIVDTNLTGGTMDVKTFISSNVSFGESKKLGAQFQPVKLELDYVEAERIGGLFLHKISQHSRYLEDSSLLPFLFLLVEVLTRAKTEGSSVSTILSDIGNLEVEVAKLSKIIDNISEYVDKVVVSESYPFSSLHRNLNLMHIPPQFFNLIFNNQRREKSMPITMSAVS
jgi:translation initiation factor 3 subunit F